MDNLVLRTIRAVVLLFFVAEIYLSTRSSRADENLATIIEQIDASRKKILHSPAGFKITYKLGVTQTKGPFLLEDGASGVVNLAWPNLYLKLQGKSKVNRTEMIREGEFDFVKHLGAGRDRMHVQIAPYRQIWTADIGLPLRLLFFEEIDQQYVLNQTNRSTYYLPAALKNAEYHLTGKEVVNGLTCTVLEKADRSDRLWIGGPEVDFAICRREIFEVGSKLIKERVNNLDFKTVHSSEVILPTKQTFEAFNYSFAETRKDRTPTYTLTLTNTILPVDRSMMHIFIPEGAQVDDQIHRVNYVRARSSEEAYNPSIKQARYDVANRRTPSKPPVFTYPIWRVIAAIVITPVNMVLVLSFIKIKISSRVTPKESFK